MTGIGEEPPALVLFELELPDMSGYEPRRAVRQGQGELPLVALAYRAGVFPRAERTL